MIGKVIKFLIIVALLGVGVVAGYALLFDLPAQTTQVVVPVTPLGQ